MKSISVLALAAAITLPSLSAEKEEWVSLFNGKDLTGWSPKIRGSEAGENYKNTFRVTDGVIEVNYSEYDKWESQYGHLFYEKKFSHYRLRLEYRFTGEQLEGGPGWARRNSGIMVHSESPETMGKDQDFPTSLEVQLLGGFEKGERTTGNLCTPGTHVVMDGKLATQHCISAKSETYRGEQWVTVEVEVRGGKAIRHLINGEEVIRYTEPQFDGSEKGKALAELTGDKIIKEGYFCLQSESHPCEFRNIEILVLEP